MAKVRTYIDYTDDAVDSIYVDYNTRLEDAVRKIDRGIIKLSTQDITPALYKAEIQKIIRQSGYREIIGGYLGAGYQSIMNESYNLYLNAFNLNYDFKPESLESFALRKSQDLDRFEDLINTTASRFNDQLVTSATAGNIPANLTAEALGNISGTFGLHTSTELETSVARTYRSANTQLAQDNGIESFQYTGPTSGNIRPFCLQNVGKIKTSKQWNEMDNGKQPKPVMEFQGGYRCRHSMVGVPDEFRDEFEDIEKETRAKAGEAGATTEAPKKQVKKSSLNVKKDATLKQVNEEMSGLMRVKMPGLKGPAEASIASGLLDSLAVNDLYIDDLKSTSSKTMDGFFQTATNRRTGKIEGTALAIRKDFYKDPSKGAAESRERFKREKEQNIRLGKKAIAEGRNVSYWTEKVKELEATKRWGVSDSSADPLYSVTLHEGAHGIRKLKKLEKPWDEAVKTANLSRLDKLSLSDYAITNNSELYSELYAYEKSGINDPDVSPKLLKVFRDFNKNQGVK